MLAFLLRRGLQSVVVLAVVGLIAFSMFRFAGDPVNQIVGSDTPVAERAQVRRSLGLDDPTIEEAVTRLELTGAVRLEAPSGGSLVSSVWLTEQGRVLRRPIEEIRAQLEATTLQAIGDDQADAFVAMAQTIEHAIEHR